MSRRKYADLSLKEKYEIGLRRAQAKAYAEHKRLGIPIVVAGDDGRAKEIAPEDIVVPDISDIDKSLFE